MKARILASTAIGISLALAPTAAAKPTGSETITTVISLPSFPSAPPYTETYNGTFTATGASEASGTLSAQALFGGVPSPFPGPLPTDRALLNIDGTGTLELRCTETARATFPSTTGSCAVLSGTGAYAGLRGSGTMTGIVDPASSTLTDTLVLKTA